MRYFTNNDDSYENVRVYIKQMSFFDAAALIRNLKFFVRCSLVNEMMNRFSKENTRVAVTLDSLNENTSVSNEVIVRCSIENLMTSSIQFCMLVRESLLSS